MALDQKQRSSLAHRDDVSYWAKVSNAQKLIYMEYQGIESKRVNTGLIDYSAVPVAVRTLISDCLAPHSILILDRMHFLKNWLPSVSICFPCLW
jgi:hypothetical protein